MASWHVGHHTPYQFFFYKIKIIFFLLIIPPTNQLSFNYPSFKQGDVNPEGDASLLRSEIHVTVDTRYGNNSYSVGHVTSWQLLYLWDKNSRNLTDFSTNFSFQIYSTDPLFGDGMTFFLADPNLPLLKKIKEGGGLGLVDGDQVLNATQHSFVAVEFDTYHNGWDPNYTHVGIDFDSMNSRIFAPWSDSISQQDTYNCSIEYNSSTHNFSVYYTRYDKDDGELTQNNLSYKVDLRDYLPEWVIVGFSAATGDLFESHILRSWSFNSSLESQTPPTPNHNNKKTGKIGLIVGLGVGLPVAMGTIALVFFLLWKWKKTEANEEESDSDQKMDDAFQKGSGPKKFVHDELVSATNNFSEAEKLGQGGFGGVYRGFLKDLNLEVAIKRVSRESKQGMQEYATEVQVISQLSHKNLVRLIGWCHKKKDFLLVYEFMPNGSLDLHLHHGKSFLTWEVRYNIALDMASALFYLHEEREQYVLHRDIKSSNIMLDSSFNAKLGDFGLAKLMDHEQESQTTRVVGTRGYIAPEYVSSGKASKESDIYSFGVVLLEIASGRKPTYLDMNEGQVTIVKWVWELYGCEMILEVADPKLSEAFNEEQLERLVVAGIWCAHPDHSCRPSITQVIQVLKFKAPLPSLPQEMPVPTFLPPTVNASFPNLDAR